MPKNLTLILLFISFFLDIDSFAATEFSVYYSSNMDGTGMCTRQDSSQSLECMILQGSIIGCRDSNQKFRCIQYGNVIANQAQFSCRLDDLNNLFLPSSQDSDLQEGKSGHSNQENTNSYTPFNNPQPLTDSIILDGIF